MEDQEKMNPMGVNPEEEQSAVPVPNAGSPDNPGEPMPQGGYPPQYGYPQGGQGAPYQQMYGYQQPYPQQGAAYQGGYPRQGAAGYGYPQGGQGAGQYAGYNRNQPYGGPAAGQYDYRAAQKAQPQQKPQGAQPGQPAGQYPYGYQQYPYQQPAGYGYYPQQYAQPNQQYPYGQPQYGYNAYQQVPNFTEMRSKMENPPVTENGEAVIRFNNTPPKPKNENRTPAAAPTPADGDIVREELSPDGKKKIVVRRVVKEGSGDGAQAPANRQNQSNTPSKFVQEKIKAEFGEDILKGKNQPVVVYKSDMKKKPDKEGVYEPSLRDMFLGPPKKKVVDREPDPFEWKCPKCNTINPDTVGTCQCGCTIREAKQIARRQRDIAAGRIPPDDPNANVPAQPQAQQPARPQPAVQQQPAPPQGQFVQQPQMQQPQNRQPEIQAQPQTPQPEAQPPLQQAAPVQAEPEKPAEQPEPEKTEPEYDPEMPEKVELTEEEIKAEIDEFMSAPIAVWRPKSSSSGKKSEAPSEIYVYGDKKNEEAHKQEKPSEAAEEKKTEEAPKNESEKPAEPEKREPEKPQETAAKSDAEPAEFDGLISDNEWKCSMCGHVNPVDNTVCKCGHTRGKRAMSYQDIINATRRKPAAKLAEPKEEAPAAVPQRSSVEKAIAEAKLKAEQEAKMAEEAKRKAEEEARRKAEEEARRKAEEEARRKAEEEARRKAEEEARRKAEEEARRKAEEEARRKAEEEARRKAEEEARRKAEEEARRKAEEEARRKAEEEARRKAEEEARRKAEEEARRKAEEEARRKAEEEARRKAEEEARRKAEEEARRKEEELAAMREKIRAEIEAKVKAEEEARIKAEEQKHKAEEEKQAAEKAAQEKAAKSPLEIEKQKAEEAEKMTAEEKRKAASMRIIREAQAKMREEEEKRKAEQEKEQQKLKEAADEDDMFDDGVDLSKLTPLQRSIEEQKRRMAMEQRAGTSMYSRNNTTRRPITITQNEYEQNRQMDEFSDMPQPDANPQLMQPSQPEPPTSRPVPPRTQRPPRQIERNLPITGNSQSAAEEPKAQAAKTHQPPVTRSIFSAFKKKPVYKQEREASANEWKCPECGLVNANYVTTCACGYRKSAKRRHVEEGNMPMTQRAPQSQPPVSQRAPQSRPPVSQRVPQSRPPISQPHSTMSSHAQYANAPRTQNPIAPRTQRSVPPRSVDPMQARAQQPAVPAAAPVSRNTAAPSAAAASFAGRRPVPPVASPIASRQPAPRPAAVPPRQPAAPAVPAVEEAPEQTPAESGLPPVGTKMDMSKPWMCFRCHRTNESYVTTCACGVTKRRCARFYETGVDAYAAQEQEDLRKAAEREKTLEKIREQQSNFGPKLFDENVIVEVEQVSNQSALERKMTNMFQSVVDKASSRQTAEPEDRLERYRQQQAPAAPVETREPRFDEWKCPNCGSINNKYTDVCSCGFTQQQARLMKQGAAVQQNVIPAAAPVQMPRAAAPAPVQAPRAATQAGTVVTPPPIPQQPAREERRTPPKSVFASLRSKQAADAAAAPASTTPSRSRFGATTRESGPSSRVVQAAPPTVKKDNDREPYFDEWKCPECGTINNDYVTACSCGCTQRRAKRIMANGGKK